MGNVGEGSQFVAQTPLTTPVLQQKESHGRRSERQAAAESWGTRTDGDSVAYG